jgi:hypothetical protein
MDGCRILPEADGYCLRATAYLHICRRCLAQQAQVAGDAIICGSCGLMSPGIYRCVKVIFRAPRYPGQISQTIQRLGSLKLRDLHPAILPDEQVEIDLDRWSDFANGNEAAWWAE